MRRAAVALSLMLAASSARGQTAVMAAMPPPERTGRVFLTHFGNAIDWGEGLVSTRDATGRIYLAGTADFGTFSPLVGFTTEAKFEWYVIRLTDALTLDPTWGAGGVVTLNFGSHDMELTSILVDEAGRIVAGGIDFTVTPTRRYKVARFNADGSLDAGFASYGIATLTPQTNDYSPVCVIAFQSTGKIVVAGVDNRDVVHRYVKLWRLNQNGNVDVTWGGTGSAIYEHIGTAQDTILSSMIIGSDDKVYVGGFVAMTPVSHHVAYIARFTAAGLADSSWGSDTGDGQYAATLDCPEGKECTFTSLIQDESGRIIGAGSGNSDATHRGALVARFSTAGVIDATFGASSGYTIHNFGLLGNDEPASGLLDSAERIVLGGQTLDATGSYYTATTRFVTYRFTAGGLVDTAYSTDGATTPAPLGDNQNTSIFYGVGSFAVVESDDSMAFPGHVNSDTGESVAVLVKLTAEGTVDTSFGDHVVQASVAMPVAETGAASSITASQATLNGDATGPVNGTTTYQFEYGVTAGVYPYRLPSAGGVVVSDGSAHAVVSVATGLLAQTPYHFRLVVTTRIGDTVRVTYGADANFTTDAGTRTIFSDTYTSPDGDLLPAHTPDVNNTGGQFWRDRSGAGSISGGRVVGTGDYYSTVTTGVLECTVSADFVWSGSGSKQPTILLRYQDSSNHWLVYMDGATFKIVERIGGNNNVRATVAQTMTAGVTYTINVNISGTTITATVNGGNQISYGSISTLTGSPNAGFEVWQSGVTMDNFLVTVP